MDKIDFRKQGIPFTQVANGVLYDKQLSLGAKTVYAFMYSKPDGWQFSANRIGQELGVSKPTILHHLNELKYNGYLLSQKLPNGRMLYKLIFPPIEPESKIFTKGQKPKSKKATVKKSHGEESLPISNKEVIVIKSISNKESSDVPSQDIAELIKLFEELEISAAASRWYGNKTQRGAAKRLLEKFGRESVEKVVRLLPKTNKRQYMPKVTTLLQLEDKWFQLRDSLITEKNKTTNTKPKMI